VIARLIRGHNLGPALIFEQFRVYRGLCIGLWRFANAMPAPCAKEGVWLKRFSTHGAQRVALAVFASALFRRHAGQ